MDSKSNYKQERCDLEMVTDGMKAVVTECNVNNGKRSDQIVDIKIEVKQEEIKEEHCWEDVTTGEVNHQSEINAGFFPVLLVSKKEAVSDLNDDLPSELPRLFTEAVYQDDNDSCSYPRNYQIGEATSDLKAPIVNTQNINKEFSARQYNCNPAEECDDYSKNFQSASEELPHEDKQLHKCDICDKIFKDKSTLRRHMFNHSGVKPYKCDSCDKSFNLKSNLTRHILVHTGIKPYKCSSCEKGFTQNSHLQIHILWHSGTKPYICAICKKTFIRKSNLEVHTLRHSGKNSYKCDICGKSFARKQYLKRHSLHHSNTKPYKCDSCGKGFNQKSHLKRHSLCHSGETPYTCNYCGRSFNRKSSLDTHTLLHSGRKPYECDVCGKSYIQKKHLQRHSLCHLPTQPTMLQL